MLFLKVLLSILSFGFLAGAIGTVAYDIYLAFQLDRILRRNDRSSESESEPESGDAPRPASSPGASSDSPSLAQSTARSPISSLPMSASSPSPVARQAELNKAMPTETSPSCTT